MFIKPSAVMIRETKNVNDIYNLYAQLTNFSFQKTLRVQGKFFDGKKKRETITKGTLYYND